MGENLESHIKETEIFPFNQSKDIKDFLEYLKENPNPEGDSERNIRDVFYHDFCVKNNGDKEKSIQSKINNTEYQKSVDELFEFLKDNGTGTYKDGHWIHSLPLVTFDRKLEKGRIYLNLIPKYSAEFYKRLVFAFKDAKLAVEMKMSIVAEYQDCRTDKMILYFVCTQEKFVLEIIETLHEEYEDKFEPSIPRFCLRLKDKDGKLMQGIGFGQEPRVYGSFSSVRADILSDVYHVSKVSNRSIFESDFFNKEFLRECENKEIDPYNLAFNANSDPEIFKLIKERGV